MPQVEDPVRESPSGCPEQRLINLVTDLLVAGKHQNIKRVSHA